MRRMAARHGSTLALAAACIAMAAAPLAAQARGGFTPGYTDLGVVVGLGGLNGGASASFGGRFEHAIKTLPDLGNGVLAFGVAADYYSFDNSFSSGGFTSSSSFKYIPIGASANYHFHLDDPRWDPFIGAGLGYYIVSCSASSSSAFGGTVTTGCGSFSSALYFIGRAGGRYFFSPKMALYADVGTGGAAFNVGLTFKLQ